MVSTAHKTKLARLREQFSHDWKKLRLKYENSEIARKSEIDPANLSSYGSGRKNPGLKVLMQFYEAFAGEIQNPFDNRPSPYGKLEMSEARTMYLEEDAGHNNELIETLRRENVRLHESLNKMAAVNEKLVQSTLLMSETNKNLLEKIFELKQLAESQKKK
jgi:hypothetical protein